MPSFLPRRSSSGSWFIQALCQYFEESRPEDSIHTVLTKVKRHVSIYKVSNTPRQRDLHEKRQIPLSQDTLIRDLHLLKASVAKEPGNNGFDPAGPLPPILPAHNQKLNSNNGGENNSMHGEDHHRSSAASTPSKKKKNASSIADKCSCM